MKNRIGRMATGLISVVAVINFFPSYAQQSAEQQSTLPSSTAGTLAEVVVGNLGFKVKSLRVAGREQYSSLSTATISIQIFNQGTTPVALDYKVGSITLTDEHGYIFYDNRQNSKVTGVGKSTDSSASLDYVIDPGQSIGIQCQLTRSMDQGQTIGQNYDFAGEFIAYQDLGEGRLKALRTYPVSIVGIQRTPAIRGAIEGVGEQVKHGFSSIFGH